MPLRRAVHAGTENVVPLWPHMKLVWTTNTVRSKPAAIEVVHDYRSSVPLMGHVSAQERPRTRSVVASVLPASGGRRLGEV